MSVVHRSHTAERKDLTSRVETCCHDIETLSGNTEKFEKQYRFFQEMRGYVTDLVECINAKVGDSLLMVVLVTYCPNAVS